MLLLVSAALAQDCPERWEAARMDAELAAADAALAAGDVDTGRAHLSTAHRQALCLDAVVRPSQVARLSRSLALAFFYDQDGDATRRWGLSARQASPALPWDETRFPPDHPFRAEVEDGDLPALAGPEGVGLAFPKKGAVFAAGHLLTAPLARIEVPLLVQVTDKDGAVVDAWWQDGAAFPERGLGPAGAAPSAPKWFVPEAAPPVTAVAVAAPAVVEPVVAAPPEPVVVAAATPEPAPVAAAAPLPGEYVDPFSDARRRALSREVSVRESVDEAGNRTVVRTEVLTFVSDPSDGSPVSVGHFADWLRDYPEWAPGGDLARRQSEGYLAGWPPADRDALVTRVSFAAAQAYCGSWGNVVAPVDAAAVDALGREWRSASGSPVQLFRGGETRPADPLSSADDLGFRCSN